jgi:hypothetical protein
MAVESLVGRTSFGKIYNLGGVGVALKSTKGNASIQTVMVASPESLSYMLYVLYTLWKLHFEGVKTIPCNV